MQTFSLAEHIQADLFPARNSPVGILAITFTPLGNSYLSGFGFAGDFLLDSGFDVLALKSSKDAWFQDLTIEQLAQLDAELSLRNYHMRVAYGSSMGGYAAIQFSKALRVQRVLVFSPQFSITSDWDKRWKREAQQIEFRHSMNRDSVSQECDFFIAFDPSDPDGLHVKKFEEIIPAERIHRILLRNTGHQAIYFMAECGMLKPLVLSILKYGVDSNIDIRPHRSKSKNYLYALSMKCGRRGKLETALRLIDAAIRLGDVGAGYHGYRSQLLEKLGRVDESIDAGVKACMLAPNEPFRKVRLADLLQKIGKLNDALTFIDEALSSMPMNSEFLRKRQVLLDRLADTVS